MTITVGLRELGRNSNILEGYDYVDVEDKKTHEYKGLFVSPKYAAEFKEFLEAKKAKQKQEALNEIMQFVGMCHGDTQNMTAQETKASKKTKY
ncbi:MAG: hypothetical protein methR_P1668 [Methyloprofundus sp.]|nr:MAG: hypothetical protein methR_P1668 [Methyloprofundus sp.]